MSSETDALTRTTQVNVLFDFYASLLTEKQRTIFTYYYHDDFSLGEIASEFNISRQAVHDNLKRAEQLLENYEKKLAQKAKHTHLIELIDQMSRQIDGIDMHDLDKQTLMELIIKLQEVVHSAEEEAKVHGSI